MTPTRNRYGYLVVVTLLTMLVALCGGMSTAAASPLLDPPPASQSLSEAPTLDGTIRSTSQKTVKQDIHAATRQEVRFGTGVLRGGQPEVGTMNVLTPSTANGMVVVYAPPTDSLSPWDAPSQKLNSGSLSDTDVAYINALLDAGYTVLIVNAYGDENPQYAGTLNGVRIANGVEAYRQSNPGTPAWCYGFSGGGIDCARVAEYQHASDLSLVIDSGPTDLSRFLAYSAVQNGLGWSAAVGLETGLTVEERQVLYPALRPSAIVGSKLLRAVSDYLPAGGLTAGFMTVSGVLFPLPLSAAFKTGSLDDPAVQHVLTGVSPSVRHGGYDGTIVERCNATDAFVPCDVHARPFAEQAGAVVITNHGVTAPGHAMMSPAQMLSIIGGNVPSSDTDTFAAPMSDTDKLTNVAIIGGMWAISQYGQWLTEQAPAVLDELDRGIVAVDEALDTAASVAQPVVEGTQAVAEQAPAVVEQITTPQWQAPTVNSQTVTEAATEWLPTEQAAQVASVVNTAPVQSVLDNAPVTLPQIPTRDQVAALVPPGITIPGITPAA